MYAIAAIRLSDSAAMAYTLKSFIESSKDQRYDGLLNTLSLLLFAAITFENISKFCCCAKDAILPSFIIRNWSLTYALGLRLIRVE